VTFDIYDLIQLAQEGINFLDSSVTPQFLKKDAVSLNVLIIAATDEK
jgi:hypothetical protein